MVDPDHHDTNLRGLRDVDENAPELRQVAPSGSLPLGLLSSARESEPYEGTPIPAEEPNRIWLELREERAGLSHEVLHVVTRTGPHTVHPAEPDLVAGLVVEIGRRARPACDECGHDDEEEVEPRGLLPPRRLTIPRH